LDAKTDGTEMTIMSEAKKAQRNKGIETTEFQAAFDSTYAQKRRNY
jgi:hypothetical protein